LFSLAGPVKPGFKALSIYDYFLAKKYFYKANKKKADACASFGLAIIYGRNDNPFHNTDSASKYAALSYNAFIMKPLRQQLSGFIIDSLSILSLCDTIAWKNWNRIKKSASRADLEHFLETNYLANKLLREQAIYKRDELDYNDVLSANQSIATEEFLRTHPESAFFSEAQLLKQRQLYNEQTKHGTAAEFITFIGNHPGNAMLNAAYENLYTIYKATSDVKGLNSFVTSYPNAPQYNEAWKLLFSLTVKSFSNSELEKFLVEYPSFPFKESILKELQLNKLTLYPYEKDDLYGFIDTTGKLVVKNEYDAVTPFSEGLSVVNKNDTVFYVNKENMNSFNQFFTDALPFKNGIAAAKHGSKWGFINRQGQLISGNYDEINELSDNCYVVKLNNKYGAIDHTGQVLIEPRFQKLGDFKNGFAYYIENGKYGFVSKSGFIHQPQFEWISDFSEHNVAIFKQDNLFGLVNTNGNIILSPTAELIVKAPKNIFIIVKGGLYGFYNASGCYITQVMFDYQKEKPAEYYTNGSVFKLIKKNEQGLVDANGKVSLDFGTYEEMNFASNGLIRVKKKNKYGYVDRKLSLIIPYKYQDASDFNDSLAIVELKEEFILLNIQGKEVYRSGERIKKLSKHYYLSGEDKTDVINNKGEKIWSGVENIQKISENLYVLTLADNNVKLLYD
jgi:hypothetical protein